MIVSLREGGLGDAFARPNETHSTRGVSFGSSLASLYAGISRASPDQRGHCPLTPQHRAGLRRGGRVCFSTDLLPCAGQSTPPQPRGATDTPPSTPGRKSNHVISYGH